MEKEKTKIINVMLFKIDFTKASKICMSASPLILRIKHFCCEIELRNHHHAAFTCVWLVGLDHSVGRKHTQKNTKWIEMKIEFESKNGTSTSHIALKLWVISDSPKSVIL